jgi:hypothetical protein
MCLARICPVRGADQIIHRVDLRPMSRHHPGVSPVCPETPPEMVPIPRSIVQERSIETGEVSLVPDNHNDGGCRCFWQKTQEQDEVNSVRVPQSGIESDSWITSSESGENSSGMGATHKDKSQKASMESVSGLPCSRISTGGGSRYCGTLERCDVVPVSGWYIASPIPVDRLHLFVRLLLTVTRQGDARQNADDQVLLLDV